jgi:branched-subunit amino acid permease
VNHPEIKIERIQWEMAAVFVAAGIALPILGILSLIKNYKYSKSLKEESK